MDKFNNNQEYSAIEATVIVITETTTTTTITTATTTSTTAITTNKKKQKRLGPAPIASFEDSSDEVRSKMDSGSSPENRLPDISEHETPKKTTVNTAIDSTCLKMLSTTTTITTTTANTIPATGSATLIGTVSLGVQAAATTPRIDISRASSSSHHDSRDSSPENVFEQVGTGTLQESTSTTLGFREDGALDLRSSTEELFFMEPEKGNQDKFNTEQQQQQTTTQSSSRRSPVMVKIDEQQHQQCLQQNQRKDSVSSEVAALLCISGRTSRVSSVGSQGSAISRLSAMSGISRSPSPHKMLLETSFCGPKPVENTIAGGIQSNIDKPTADILEQVILARKHDPTKAVLAEGIHINTQSTPKHNCNKGDKLSSNVNINNDNNNNIDKIDKIESCDIKNNNNTLKPSTATTAMRKSGGVLKYTPKPIMGKTPSGVEYVRIKLKPDHLYDDNGLAINEYVSENTSGDSVKKPDTLSLGQGTPSKKAAPHFSQLVQSDSKSSSNTSGGSVRLTDRLTPSASPKPSRHTILREIGSRSPSPATIANVSRKSSFCSLFKSNKESPESPTILGGGQRKKSGISVLLNDSPRDRSRSKSRDSELGVTPVSTTATPNKQKSVLAIFKPKKGGNKSKSSSPIDPAAETLHDIPMVEFQFKNEKPDKIQSQKLRYYDSPLDGNVIHIPLHTPPEEKTNEDKYNVKIIDQIDIDNNNQKTSINVISSAVTTVTIMPTEKSITPTTTMLNKNSISIVLDPNKKLIEEQSVIATNANQDIKKDNSDSSIPIIPLKSSRSDDPIAIVEADSVWSMEVHRNSSIESQETVISSQIPSLPSIDNLQNGSRKSSNIYLYETKDASTLTVENNEYGIQPLSINKISQASIQPPTSSEQSSPLEIPITTENTTPLITSTATTTITTSTAPENTTSTNTANAKDKKRILFCTKIGSGSEEQIFSTQFSLSKTESLSSQLSEQASILDSPNGTERDRNVGHDNGTINNNNNNTNNTLKTKDSFDEAMKRTRSKISADIPEVEIQNEHKSKEFINTNRHSMYIENIDEILEKQRLIDEAINKRKTIDNTNNKNMKNCKTNNIDASFTTNIVLQKSKPDPILQIPGPPPIDNNSPSSSISPTPTTSSPKPTAPPLEERCGSSDSEMDPSTVKQLVTGRQFGTVEEESTGLVTQESFDDELPYIPTTLPEERSVCVSLVPIKERSLMDIKTCPVERPRSTTPLNPSFLEEYCGTTAATTDDFDQFGNRCEKIRISLPRKNSRSGIITTTNDGSSGTPISYAGTDDDKNTSATTVVATGTTTKSQKSPRRISNAGGKSWFEFAEQGMGIANSSGVDRRNSNQQDPIDIYNQDESSPPPLPPRKTPQNTSQWINFDNIPEKRKPPKRITTIPNKESRHHTHNYEYVNPDECKCECHDKDTGCRRDSIQMVQTRSEDTVPLLEQDSEGLDRTSISDSSIDENDMDNNVINDKRNVYNRNSNNGHSSSHVEYASIDKQLKDDLDSEGSFVSKRESKY